MPKKIMSDKDVEALNKVVEWHANNENSRISLTPREATFDLIHNAPHPLFDPLELVRWDDQSGGLYRHRITGCYVYAWETTGGFDTHTLDDDDDVPEE